MHDDPTGYVVRGSPANISDLANDPSIFNTYPCQVNVRPQFYFAGLPHLLYGRPQLEGLPTKYEQLKESNTRQKRGDDYEGVVGRRFLVPFLLTLFGFLAALGGIHLDDKRRLWRATLIGGGYMVCGLGWLLLWLLNKQDQHT